MKTNSRPIKKPIATPPAATPMNSRLACHSENTPVSTVATANL